MTTMTRRTSGLYVPFGEDISIHNIGKLMAHHRDQFAEDSLMAIVASDMVLRQSVLTGSAGDTVAGSSTGLGAPGSLGKYVSTTALGTALKDLFDDVSGAENAASTVDYRCVFLLNNHATLTASSISIFLSAEVSGGASVALAIDNLAASAKGGASAQAAQIATETTTPSSIGSFSSPTTDGTGLSLGTLTAGQVRAIWVRRTAANSAALSADGFTFGVSFDTPA